MTRRLNYNKMKYINWENFNHLLDDLEKADNKKEEIIKNIEDKKAYCDFIECEVTYRKVCRACIFALWDKDGNFCCPDYKD